MVVMVKLTEKFRVDLHNTSLYQRVSTWKLLIARVVNNVENTQLDGLSLQTLHKVAYF